jgi:hypothetical protein
MLTLKSMRRMASWSCIILVLALNSCDALDNLISVEAPSQVAAEDLDNPANADLMVNSAINEFRCALVHFISAGAYVGNEWSVGHNQGGGSYVWYDARTFEPQGWTAMYATGDCTENAPNVYEPLSTARWLADDALNRLDSAWSEAEIPNRTELEAKAAAFAGYSLTLLGEAMCAAAIDGGPELTPADIFTLADARFTRAVSAAQSAGEDDILNVARVGQARALLNLGQPANAANVAALVPAGFSYEFMYSSADDATENKIYALMERELMATVEPMYRDMRFLGDADPRVVAVDLGVVGPATTIEIWGTTKYTSLESPVPVATWEEAQLIVAEAAYRDGRYQDAVEIINLLHDAVGLQDFVSTDPDEIWDQLIYERAAELFLEGQHMQDLERLNLTLVPAAGAPAYHGGVYSDQICFPLPEVEYLNNPNINR